MDDVYVNISWSELVPIPRLVGSYGHSRVTAIRHVEVGAWINFLFADHSGSVASWLESGVGASYGIMRANCPDLPGQLQSAGGLPPETHGNPWPEAQR
jgi:hypothetical protein